jgi:hypothetical protein
MNQPLVSRGVALSSIVPGTAPADLHSAVANRAVPYDDRRLFWERVVLVDLLVRRFLVCSFRYVN